MKKLIVNADDYGYTSNISRGIRDSFTKGILTSTSAIMNFGAPIDDIYVAMEETPGLAIGVHLNLYKGKPVAPVEKVKTLVNDDGMMLGKQGVVDHALIFDIEDMEIECRAQIDAFLSTGCKLDHINTHGIDSICFSTEAWGLFLKLSQEYNCATRVPINWGLFPEGGELYYQQFGLTKDQVVAKYEEQMNMLEESGVFHADRFGIPVVYEQSPKGMVEYLKALPDGLTEYACHAGYSDAELAKFSTVTDERDRAVEILISPVVRKAIEENDIILTTHTKEYELFRIG
ncbi:MAG: ChbG/HpnK family deacetylase [Anaerolineaceae bacterium]|jgi:hypothetical protein|nr:MAG: ChbG/HpnK family deacetylase [Anaerolineaceae bacterium]